MSGKIITGCSIKLGEDSINLHDKVFDVDELLKPENYDLLKESNIPIYKLLPTKYPFLDIGCTKILFDIFDITDFSIEKIEKFLMQFPFMNKEDMIFKFDILLKKSLVYNRDRYIDVIKMYYGIGCDQLDIQEISLKSRFSKKEIESIIRFSLKLLRLNRNILFQCDTIINIWSNKKDWYQRGILFRNHINSLEDLIVYKSKLQEENDIKQIECLIYDIVSYECFALNSISEKHSESVEKKEKKDEKSKRDEEIRKIPLASLKLSRKTFDALIQSGCITVGDAYDLLYNDKIIRKYKKLGKVSVAEIAKVIDKIYLTNRFKHYYFYDNLEEGVYKEPILKSENEKKMERRINYLEKQQQDNKSLRFENKRLRDKCIRCESEIDVLNKKLDDLEYIKSVFERLEPIEQDGRKVTFELELYNDERIVFH